MDDQKERRSFNSSERIALTLQSGGLCSVCGVPLDKSWEADHIHPFSRGGSTDVINGQALCKPCNREKGSKVIEELGQEIDFHASGLDNLSPHERWQIRCLSKYQGLDPNDFLIYVSPGGGKTYMSLRIAKLLIEAGRIKNIIVLVTGTALKEQWAVSEALPIGLKLDYAHENHHGVAPNTDFDGVVLTYQQVVKAPHLYRIMSKDSLVIFDEVHHSAEGLAWGNAMKEAFQGEHCRRIALSGTPIRNSNHPITFLWNDDGEPAPTFKYLYGQATADRVVAPISFRFFSGDAEWLSRAGEWIKHGLKDEIDAREESRRYRAILQADEKWLESMLVQADDLLSDIRVHFQSDAGAWVRCMDVHHAERVARVLARITGEVPDVVHSEQDEPAAKQINRFRDGHSRWLVAIDMVNEGTNIPRLWIGCHATLNRESFSDFMQEALRLVRISKGVEDKTAYFLAPYDKKLMEHAGKIMEEVELGLQIKVEDEIRESRDRIQQLNLFLAGETSEAEHDTSIYEADQYEGLLVQRMTTAARANEAKDAPEKLLQIFRDFNGGDLSGLLGEHNGKAKSSSANASVKPSDHPRKQIKDMKDRCRNLLGDLMRERVYSQGLSISKDEKQALYQSANALLNTLTGVGSINDTECGLAKLSERLDIIKGWADGSRSDFVI